jgi:hypothetical protein
MPPAGFLRSSAPGTATACLQALRCAASSPDKLFLEPDLAIAVFQVIQGHFLDAPTLEKKPAVAPFPLLAGFLRLSLLGTA